MIFVISEGVFRVHGRPDTADKRLTINRSVRVERPAGPVGQPGSKVRPAYQSRLHKGKMALCPHCNPLNWESMKRLEERFARRSR